MPTRSTSPAGVRPAEYFTIVEQRRGVGLELGQLRREIGPPLAAPVAEHVTQEVLGGVRAKGMQFADLFIQTRGPRIRLKFGRAPRRALGPMLHQPVAQRLGGTHVVFVVRGDADQLGRIVVGHVSLVLDDGARAPVDLMAALERRQSFEGLQSIGLGTDLHSVARHREQIDEQPGLHQPAQFDFTYAVVGGQPLEGGSLRVVVVVDVHARVS